MSRTIRGSKGSGYDFWSRRPASGNGHGPAAKAETKAAERMQKKSLILKECREALTIEPG